MKKAKVKVDLEKSQDADWDEVSQFFALLLEIDIKNNPHLYKKKYDRHNTINSARLQSNQISR